MPTVFLKEVKKLTYQERLGLVPVYGNAILEDHIDLCCLNCSHYDFSDDSQQICNNTNNNQLNDDNADNEARWYKMMVTPDFCCNEWEKAL
jgi:hypothetical protein